MTPLPSLCTRSLLVLVATAALTAAADAQVFTRVTDPANPIVTDPGAPGFAGAAWIDFDEDGRPDLFVGGQALYRNLGGGAFAKIVIPNLGPVLGVSWADFDNDGDADLMTAGGTNNGQHGSRLFRNDGGQFNLVTIGPIADSLGNVGWSPAWGDYDGDGWVDLVIAQPFGFTGFGPNLLFHNEGGGVLTRDLATDVTVGTAPYTVPSWSDFDLDGDLDLSIGSGPANGTKGPDYFYRNLTVEGGSPRLDRITAGALATDTRDGQIVNWIDYDNDGDLDVFITNYNNSVNHLYRNDAGTMVKMTSVQVGSIVADLGWNLANLWDDFDNDGDLDCFVGRTSGFNNRYYRNNGGTFVTVSQGTLTSTPAGTAVTADYDQDGDVDLYLSAATTAKALYRNDLANGNHWLELRLIGTTSNRSAIGARVRARAVINGVAVWQMREVSAQNSFNGHGSFVVHFGLGSATAVDSVEIHWPRGQVTRREGVAADQILTITEDAATPNLFALIAAAVRGRDVTLTWQGAGLDHRAAIVERRRADEAWSQAGQAERAGEDRVTFVDRDLAAGSWGYRLGVDDGGTMSFTAETRVDVGGNPLWLRADPTAGTSLALEFELPRDGEVALQLFDTGGRRVAARDLGVLGSGRHAERIDVASLGAGVYWVRLRHAGRSVTTRTTVLR